MKRSFKEKAAYAFIKSVPVMCGYIFLGIAFGIVLKEAGYGIFTAVCMSTFIYAGSAQFVMVPLMAGGASVVTVAVTILFVNFRHVFYGLSFVDAFSKMKEKPYMIFALTDETYSVLCGCRNEDMDASHRDSWFMIALFNQLYWVAGSVIGVALGNIIPADLTGIDFSMTALFVVILLEQILKSPGKAGLIAGISMCISVICLFIFGTTNFLLPALLLTVLASAFMAGKEKAE